MKLAPVLDLGLCAKYHRVFTKLCHMAGWQVKTPNHYLDQHGLHHQPDHLQNGRDEGA